MDTFLFNNTLFQDDMCVKGVIDIIDDSKSCPLYTSDILIWWDNLKYNMLLKCSMLNELHYYVKMLVKRLFINCNKGITNDEFDQMSCLGLCVFSILFYLLRDIVYSKDEP